MALEELLATCGFALAATAQPTLVGAGMAGDATRWRRLLGACHAHLQGGAEPAAQPSAALVVTPEGRLELIMERTDIHERWHMSVLREQLIRQLAAAVGAVLSSEVPHLPLKLSLSARVDPVVPAARSS